jgi:hypothetical protein
VVQKPVGIPGFVVKRRALEPVGFEQGGDGRVVRGIGAVDPSSYRGVDKRLDR